MKLPNLKNNFQDENRKFLVKSDFSPAGDQPKAIFDLAMGIENGMSSQILLGATGTGKTYTIAKVIEKVQKPTLVIAHNKTLAAQLASEFKEFFPDNAVEYFVSYYDYYQPEAYVPSTDTYIEKDSSINDEIDRLRHSATCSLFERKDVIIVASVSCIYGLGSPEEYHDLVLSLRIGQNMRRDDILRKLIEIQYTRNDINFLRGTFRVIGDVIEIYPAGFHSVGIRVELFDEEIESIKEFDILTRKTISLRKHITIYPASHYVAKEDTLDRAKKSIQEELDNTIINLEKENKILEAARIKQRTNYDLEMISEMGYCSGIENYSRHLSGRSPEEAPYTLLDFFPKDFLMVIDESHVTIPQIRAMYEGDRSRKTTLVDHGFRLPSALDNRPLKFDEFYEKINQIIYVSATPGTFEMDHNEQIVEQIIRPTGLLDPKIEIRPLKGQIDDLISEINIRKAKNERVLITTLTKKMAESLTDYFKEMGISAKYLHSDVTTFNRAKIIKELRMGVFDVLIGINLLREGLDIPEVSLVAILDADKEGFLRSTTSMIQTIGRAARNANGFVIMYADIETDSMKKAIKETNRRRKIQIAYNEKHNIIPKTIVKKIKDLIETTSKNIDANPEKKNKKRKLSKQEKVKYIEKLTKEMELAAKKLDFETATILRDEIFSLKDS